MAIRLCKLSLVASSAFFLLLAGFLLAPPETGEQAFEAFFLLLVVFNNLTDYRSNYLFVENVLGMTTVFEGNSAMWRAIRSPWVHHLFYASIILWEAIAMGIIAFGSWKLFQNLKAPAADFNRAKEWAIVGLTISLLQWFVAFITVGGEWFLMWQSDTWNGQDAAHRMFVCLGIILLFLYLEDGDITKPAV